MAFRPARRVRPVLALAALAATALVAPNLAAATPRAEPTVTSVQKQLGELAVRNSQLVEQYNQARISVTRHEKAATRAEQAAKAASATYRAASVAFTRNLQIRYETGGMDLGGGGALLDSGSNTDYLDRLDTINLAASHDSGVVKNVTKTRSQAQATSAAAAKALASATVERDALFAKRSEVDKQIKKYKNMLTTLQSAARAAYLRAANPTVSTQRAAAMTVTKASSAQARRAVEFALAQVGKPYIFGAAGPDAFDCSGLTLEAWRAGGVSLPHSAADQYNYGTHVSRDALEPGDLIFFYSPIGHVTIYIGDGLMVSASTEGVPVAVVPVAGFNSDFAGATRLT